MICAGTNCGLPAETEVQSRVEYESKCSPQRREPREVLSLPLREPTEKASRLNCKAQMNYVERIIKRAQETKQKIRMPSRDLCLLPLFTFMDSFSNVANPRVLLRLFSSCGRNVSSIYREHMLSSNKSLERKVSVTIEMTPLCITNDFAKLKW